MRLVGRLSRSERAAAAVMTPAMTCRTRSAARSGSGCPASSQAMTASIAAVGASWAAHRAHAASGTHRRDLQVGRLGDVATELLGLGLELRLPGGVLEQQPEPGRLGVAACSSPSMLASVNPPTGSATWRDSTPQNRSSTAWYRSVFESKCRYRITRVIPASAAMSSRLVAANPLRANARVAAARICSRRCARGKPPHRLLRAVGSRERDLTVPVRSSHLAC